MFNSNEQKQKNGEGNVQIHVMPQRFYQAPKKSNLGLILIIVFGLILVAGLSVLAYYFSQQFSNASVNSNINSNNSNVGSNTNVSSNINSNNSNVGSNVNANVNANTNANANVNPNANTNLNANTNANANANVNINANLNVNREADLTRDLPLPSAPDKDGDGLTAEEEKLFNTSADKADSDGDGFTDGAELLAGYDPTKKNKTLAASGLIQNYSTPLYSLIYPKKWQLREEDTKKEQVLFMAETGEFVEVLAVANPDGLTLEEWYRLNFAGTSLNQLTALQINGLDGLRAPDNLTYYFISPEDKSQIYILTYNAGNFLTTNFAMTFEMIEKSFKLR